MSCPRPYRSAPNTLHLQKKVPSWTKHVCDRKVCIIVFATVPSNITQIVSSKITHTVMCLLDVSSHGAVSVSFVIVFFSVCDVFLFYSFLRLSMPLSLPHSSSSLPQTFASYRFRMTKQLECATQCAAARTKAQTLSCALFRALCPLCRARLCVSLTVALFAIPLFFYRHFSLCFCV